MSDSQRKQVTGKTWSKPQVTQSTALNRTRGSGGIDSVEVGFYTVS